MRIEVIDQGPWGERAEADATRTFHEALPGDTIRFEPLVADEDGPLAPEDLSARWVLCPANECLEGLSTADALEPCDEELPYTDIQTCSLGDEPIATWRMGDVPLDLESPSIFALAFGPNVAYVASRHDDPGASACVRALRDRESLDGCMLMLRDVSIGPVSALIEAAEAFGIEIELSEEGLELLLAEPRNRNPEAQQFAVSIDSGDAIEVTHGSTIQATIGDEIEVTWVAEEDDFDDYEVELSGETVEVQEQVRGRWYLDRRSSRFAPLDTSVRWSVEGAPGIAHLFFVLGDDGGSEVWGWLTFDISAS